MAWGSKTLWPRQSSISMRDYIALVGTASGFQLDAS